MSPLAHPHVTTFPHSHSQQEQAFGVFHLAENPTPSVGDSQNSHQGSASHHAHRDLSPDARELAQEIDRYKFRHRRRFINYEEVLALVKTLGYRKECS